MTRQTEITELVWYVVRQAEQAITQFYVKFSEELTKAMKSEKGKGYSDFEPETTEARVTDRRRVRLNEDEMPELFDENESTVDNANSANATASASSPSESAQVAQLTQRAHAAEAKLIEVQQRFDQLRAQMQQETEGLRTRLQRTADERVATEKAAFIASLLPVLDNFERAIAAAESGSTVESLINGLRGTLGGFENALANAGVETVASVGTQFDPETHEAVDTTQADEDGVVTAEYARGFRFGNRLLRPARVQVGRK